MAKQKGRPQQGKFAGWIAAAIVLGSALVGGWFFYRSTIMPWSLANHFFDVVDHATSAESVTNTFAPDRRQSCCSAADSWLEGLRGRSKWSFARKAMSLGTTRGGKSLASVNGYIHYPNSSDERTFSITFIEIEGDWYTDSFTLGPRNTPR